MVEENMIRLSKTPMKSKEVGIVSVHELREIRNKTIQGKKNDAVIISNDELQRIR